MLGLDTKGSGTWSVVFLCQALFDRLYVREVSVINFGTIRAHIINMNMIWICTYVRYSNLYEDGLTWKQKKYGMITHKYNCSKKM